MRVTYVHIRYHSNIKTIILNDRGYPEPTVNSGIETIYTKYFPSVHAGATVCSALLYLGMQ